MQKKIKQYMQLYAIIQYAIKWYGLYMNKNLYLHLGMNPNCLYVRPGNWTQVVPD